VRALAAAALLLAASAQAQETTATVLLLPLDLEGVTPAAAESVRAQAVKALEALGARVEPLPEKLFSSPPRRQEDMVRARNEVYARGATAYALLALHDHEDPRKDVAMLRLVNVQGHVLELGAAGHLENVAVVPEFADRLQELWRELGDSDRVRLFLSDQRIDRVESAIRAARANPRSLALLLERRIAVAESRLAQVTRDQQANWRAEFERVRRGTDLGRDEWAFSEFERLLRERKGAPPAMVPPDAPAAVRLEAYESLLSSAVLWGGLRRRPAEMEVLLARHRAAVMALRGGDAEEAGAIIDSTRGSAELIVREIRAEAASR
jgi:hypothetical protein